MQQQNKKKKKEENSVTQNLRTGQYDSCNVAKATLFAMFTYTVLNKNKENIISAY